jgi:hypothetical protein
MSMMTRYRQEDQMRLALHLALLSLLACYPAHAQAYEHGTALLCDSQEQVERYVALFKGEEQSTVDAVNTEEQNPHSRSSAFSLSGWTRPTASAP